MSIHIARYRYNFEGFIKKIIDTMSINKRIITITFLLG